MELWTGALSWWKCHWPDLKSAGLFRRNLFLNSLKNLNIVILTLTLWLINSGVLTSLLLPHLSPSLTDSPPSLNLLCHSKTDTRFMQDVPKAVWSIPYISVAFFPSLKHNFIAYRFSKVSSRRDCIFEIYQLWQSGFSRVYSNCCGCCSFEAEIIKICQSSHKMYSNNSEFSRVYDNFECPYEKSLETYWMPRVYILQESDYYSSTHLFYLSIFYRILS